ncbi:DegT/DnrJ/EryC1/StrS family aminotransferase [Photorhabdus heterorhabditis]|uniref:DegT/DnrJ/EryC1/StrS family aminotransferase n=1 Tax=Photorhabdus heterorhabditis TaxID=880156 RepID=UPI001BD45431|nr:aminotransferase class V-fold PLP-dependent enzyme [Photorhabdus heterorhabditis]MBS9442132.1 aminotransferase class V-fold PLP-dependent enzyme [Photorhabdus heterorhabditis]
MKINDSYKKKPHSNDLIELEKVLDLGKLSGKSDTVEQFEKKIAELFEVDDVVCCSSGTSALIASLMAEDISADDEVLVPCYTTIPTTFPILSVGAKPVFIDTKTSHTTELSIDDLLSKINDKTKAIIAVPLWGYPVNYDEIAEVCKSRGIIVIDDAAQAHFSTFKTGRLVGTFSDYGCFSLHDKKILSTGEGGFIIPSSPQRTKRLREIVNLGNLNGLSFGLNFKLGSLQAALGISRCTRVYDELTIRRENAEKIKEGIVSTRFEEIDCLGQPNYYNLVLKDKDHRDLGNVHEVLKDMGFETDFVKYGEAKYKFGILNKFYDGSIEKGDTVLKNLITIPTHPDLSQEGIDYIIEILEKVSC